MENCIVNVLRFILGIEYRELKAEWEKQNILIDELTLERNRAEKQVKALKSQVYNLTRKQTEEKKKGKKKC